MSAERLCGSLRSAHENLCIAQTDAQWPGHRVRLQEAIDIIEQVGAFACPQWSKYRAADGGRRVMTACHAALVRLRDELLRPLEVACDEAGWVIWADEIDGAIAFIDAALEAGT